MLTAPRSRSSRRLAAGARAVRLAERERLSPACRLAATVALAATTILDQIDFWREYIRLGDLDPMTGYIPVTGYIPAASRIEESAVYLQHTPRQRLVEREHKDRGNWDGSWDNAVRRLEND